jgi:thioredoxin-dependent peroxiredoxin
MLRVDRAAAAASQAPRNLSRWLSSTSFRDASHPPDTDTDMKHIILSCFLSSVITLPAFAALKEGDAAPEFKAPASFAGKTINFSLKDSLKKGPVVVYFYPSAYTGGCNLQAHTFAVNYDKFAAAGASIIGVSLDSIDRLNDFSADPEFCAGKFPTASDADGKIAKSFDLKVTEAQAGRKDTRGAEINHGFAERTTFVVTPDGKIVATIGGISPVENVNKALEAVQQLPAGKQATKKSGS